MRRRLIRVFKVVLANEDDARSCSGGGDLEEGSEGGPGSDRDYALLLNGVHVDCIQHGQEDATTLTKVGLLPQGWQVLQEPPGGDCRIGIRHNQRPQLFLQLLLLPAVFLIGDVAIKVDLSQPAEPLLRERLRP